MTKKEEKIKEKLQADPGNPVFSEFAEYLRRQKRWHEALEVCCQGLSVNPGYAPGRVVLARLYYQKNWLPFALRELETVFRSDGKSESLERLLKKLDPNFNPDAVGGQTDGKESGEELTMIAETEFDLGELDLLDT